MSKGFGQPELSDVEVAIIQYLKTSGQCSGVISAVSGCHYTAQSVFDGLSSLKKRQYIYQKAGEKNTFYLTKMAKRLDV